jgi:hypothetical protein
MLAKIGSQQVYNTIPKYKEWLIITYAINDAWGFLPRFYIFKGERIKGDCIRDCELGTCIHAKKIMGDMFYVQFIFEVNPYWHISIQSPFKLTLNGYDSHVILKVINMTQPSSIQTCSC